MLFAFLSEEKAKCFAPANARSVALPPANRRARYAHTRAFELHHLRAMVGAFDVVSAHLRLPTHEGGWARKRVASMIFDLAMAGETDEKRLATKVLAEFRLEGHHRTSRPIG